MNRPQKSGLLRMLREEQIRLNAVAGRIFDDDTETAYRMLMTTRNELRKVRLKLFLSLHPSTRKTVPKP